MPSGNRLHPALLCAALTAIAALLVAGCGSSDESEAPTGPDAKPSASAFPAAEGRNLEEIAAAEATESEDLVAAPSSQVFEQGENRYGFGLFTIENEPIADAEVALYAAQPGKPALGPFPAAAEDLAVEAAFQSVSTSTDPDAAENVYVSEVDFETKGAYQLMALVKEGDSYEYVVLNAPAEIDKFTKVPDVGEKAPETHTDVAADVGGDLTKIDTRQPPTTMHEEDLAEVAGKEPVVLLFATPALCQSRVCGPVADITEQVKSERDEDAAFIMQEIFVDNSIEKGTRPPVNAFNLPSEPWLFVLDSEGRISTRIEGAFSEGELNEALDKVSQPPSSASDS